MKPGKPAHQTNLSIFHAAGMTLIEIVMVVAMLGILLSIAMPSYQRYVERGHRVEAIQVLLAAAACQERHRAATGFFDTTRCAGSSGGEYYRLLIEPEAQTSSTEYTLIAEPLDRQKNEISAEVSNWTNQVLVESAASKADCKNAGLPANL